MRRLIISPRARRDLAGILHHSRQTFGEDASRRYKLLIKAGYRDLIEEPERPAARPESRADSPVWLYHLRHVGRRVPGAKVAGPRHLIVYRFDSTQVEIVRLLHDAMDLAQQLTNDA